MRLVILCIVLYWSAPSFGQTFLIHYTIKDSWVEKQLPDSIFSNAISAKKYIAALQNKNIENGFLLSSFVSLPASKDSTLQVIVYSGPKFQTVTLHIDSNEQSFLKKKSVFHSDIKFRPKVLKNYLTLVRDSYLNNGYPFVSVEIVQPKIT